MDEANATRYWCHMCSQTVNEVVMEEEIKCPLCRSGFIEEMMNNSATRNNQSAENETGNNGRDLDSQLQEILRRRARRPVSVSLSVVQLLREALEPGSNRDDDDDDDNNNNGTDRERGGGLIFIDPHQQIIAIPRSLVTDSMPVGSSLTDFISPGFEALLQHLTENDPNRYGTPPARKEDVESLATVRIQEPGLQCSVCLDDFEVGIEAKQMPCKHSFHGDCLLPWLELHSSCPVCRFQLATDETKTTDESATNDNSESSGTSSSSQGTENSDGNRHEGEEEDGNRNGFPIPWPLSSLFSSSSSSQDSNPST